MEAVVRAALGSHENFERYDRAEAQSTFERWNEGWEEAYAALYDNDLPDVPIPETFLEGRKAYFFHMFFRVMDLHDKEVEQIKATKEKVKGGWR